MADQEVTYVTPDAMISAWTRMTDEQFFIQKRSMELGVRLALSHSLCDVADAEAQLACMYTDRQMTLAFASLVLVTGRVPERSLYDDLVSDEAFLEASGIQTVARIGDCLVASTLADTVYSGHCYARSLEEPQADLTVRRERPIAHGESEARA
jgi:dimethylamine/trimethylamine dehydrogenase